MHQQQRGYQPKPMPMFQGVYLGKRDDSFRQLISSILETGEISKRYISELLTPRGLSYFSTAFTHESADRDNNYEFLETLGDATLDTCTVWYLAKRFPQIRCKAGSDIFTKLKITLVQSKNFASLADDLGFWEFISMAKNLSEVKDEKILEDVFESCFAVIQLLLDDKFGIGVGHVVCYKIIAKILDKKNIRIVYEDLVDAKTRLKELFDRMYTKQRYGEFAYYDAGSSPQSHKVEILFGRNPNIIGPHNKNTKSYLRVARTQDMFTIGSGQSSRSLVEAEQNAAQAALDYLKTHYSLVKEIPPEYLKFCT
jgi:dsRNA-specific ribonuclease